MLCLGAFGPNYMQFQLAPLAPQLMDSMQINQTEFASLLTAAMLPSVFFSLPSGALADKVGIKKILLIGNVLTAVGAAIRWFATSYATLYIGMVLLGFGIAFVNTNTPKILSRWFPPERVGIFIGIELAASTGGIAVGTGTAALLPGIRSAYGVGVVLSVITIFLYVVFMRDPAASQATIALSEPSELSKIPQPSKSSELSELPQPSRSSEPSESCESPQIPQPNESSKAMSVSDSLRVVLSCKKVWFVGFCLMFTFGVNILACSFLPTALGQRGIETAAAGFYASIFTVGNIVGCMVSPGLSARIRRKKLFLLLCIWIAAVGIVFAWKLPTGFILLTALLATGTVLGGTLPLLISIPIQLAEIGSKYAGTAGGVACTLQLLGAVVIPTYIVSPIAAGNMDLLFLLGGCIVALATVFAVLLPDSHSTERPTSEPQPFNSN